VKIGIISDIHSNLEALEVMLLRLEREGVERIYCLGDVVGYGANPNECLDKIRAVCQVCIMGNHDDALIGGTAIEYFNPYARAALEWTTRIITDENLAYLKSLPLTHVEDGLLLVHATPAEPTAWSYILRPDDAEPHFRVMGEGVTAFIGHSHLPARFEDEPTKKRIINVGSVGQPRDRDPRAACGLYDTVTGTFDWLREVYPVQEAARKIRQANLPEFLAARLFIGM
jgi:diadenosine tetraphosphatase ApaH/serine/threonine PP2A family protein phosphatase